MKQRADNRSGKNKALPVAAAVVATAALAVTLFTARPAPKAEDAAAPAGGDIAFTAKEIGTQASYFDYDDDGTTVQVLAVRAPDDTVRMALNTCQVCNGSPYAYFEQEGDFFFCQNCKNRFSSSDVGIVSGGCNPVVWTIEADAAALNGCNNELVLPAFDRQVRLTEGRNTITFTPEEPGEYLYSCWMGMLRNTITVVPQETGTESLF